MQRTRCCCLTTHKSDRSCRFRWRKRRAIKNGVISHVRIDVYIICGCDSHARTFWYFCGHCWQTRRDGEETELWLHEIVACVLMFFHTSCLTICRWFYINTHRVTSGNRALRLWRLSSYTSDWFVCIIILDLILESMTNPEIKYIKHDTSKSTNRQRFQYLMKTEQSYFQ